MFIVAVGRWRRRRPPARIRPGRARLVAEGFQLPPGKHSVTWRDPDSLYAAVVLSEADATASGYPREVKLWQRGQPFAQAHSLLKAEHRALAVSAWRMLNPDGGAPVDIIEEALIFYRTRYWRVLPDLEPAGAAAAAQGGHRRCGGGQLIVRLNQAWGDLDAGVLLALTGRRCAPATSTCCPYSPLARASRRMARWPAQLPVCACAGRKASASCGYTPPPPTAGRQQRAITGQGQLEMVDQPWQSNAAVWLR